MTASAIAMASLLIFAEVCCVAARAAALVGSLGGSGGPTGGGGGAAPDPSLRVRGDVPGPLVRRLDRRQR